MRNTLVIAAALVMLAPVMLHAAEPSKKPATNGDISNFTMKTTAAQSLEVVLLRDTYCGGNLLVDQDANNAAFAACMMYVLGAVDMIREWQKADPAHSPPACIPRTISAGGLILAVQEHIEATAPWREQQSDASTAVIAALAAKWPCHR